MLPACHAEASQWRRKVRGFLTPRVVFCTDCHFNGWGHLTSLSWCVAVLLGDTERFLGELWVVVLEVCVPFGVCCLMSLF